MSDILDKEQFFKRFSIDEKYFESTGHQFGKSY